MSLMMSILLLGGVLALSPFAYKSYNLKLVQKNPFTWEEVDGGHGNVLLSHGVKNQKVEFRAHAIVLGMIPNMDYTLVYYGAEGHNDEWDYVTCISSGTTNKHGNVRLPSGVFDYSSMINDGIAQKFWVVPTMDLDCENNRFLVWAPTIYLFETETI